ncbi:MAG: hydantoinase/oxoprolinase N-terminal domain-containing protein, partial [Pseudomonadota bacterium]
HHEPMSVRVGIDIGGTFTDIVLEDGERRLTAKVLTRPDAPDEGAMDAAAAVSFYEHEPFIPEVQAAWVEGYREVADLPAADEAMLPTFVMLRRLLLTAWLASHSETPTAQELGDGYTDGTVAIAERYLSGRMQAAE